MIDTSKWKKFKIGNLFENMYKSKAHIKQDLFVIDKYSYNSIPFITRTNQNNGCDGYVIDYYGNDIEEGNAFIIGDTTATYFYQKHRFIAGDHIVVCRASWLNKYTAIFLKSILEKEYYRYSYGRAFKIDLIKKAFIKLPAIKQNDSYKPDWQWIENYMKSIEYKLPQTKNKSQNKKLDTSKWREFIISELFIIKPTLGVVSDDLIKGADVAYIAAKKSENGLKYMCQKEGFENWISKGNCIIFIQLGAGSAGYALYMKDDFIGMNGKISCGYIDNILNKYIGVFLTTVLSMERPKYSFGRSWTGERLQNTVIKLPALHDKNNNIILDKSCKFSSKGYIPDWQYMENYIKSLPYGDLI